MNLVCHLPSTGCTDKSETWGKPRFVTSFCVNMSYLNIPSLSKLNSVKTNVPTSQQNFSLSLFHHCSGTFRFSKTQMTESGNVKRNILQKEFYVIHLQWLSNKLVYKSLHNSASDKSKICSIACRISSLSGNL